MQKQLKEEEGKVYMIYSFESKKEWEIEVVIYFMSNPIRTLIFSGTKTELKEKGEEFWKPLVIGTDWYFPENHKVWWNYKKPEDKPCPTTGQRRQGWNIGFATAKESGISAIEDMKEFIIIAQEEKK